MSQKSAILIWLENAINFTDKFNIEPEFNSVRVQKRRKVNNGEAVNVIPSCSYQRCLGDSVRYRIKSTSTTETGQNVNLPMKTASRSTQTPNFGEDCWMVKENQSKFPEPSVLFPPVSTDSEKTSNSALVHGHLVSDNTKAVISLSPSQTRVETKTSKDNSEESSNKMKKPRQRRLSNIQFKDSVGASGTSSIGGFTFSKKDIKDIKTIMLQTCDDIAGKLIAIKRKKKGPEREIQISVNLSLPLKAGGPDNENSCSPTQP